MEKKIMWVSQHFEIDTKTGRLINPNDLEDDEDDEDTREDYDDIADLEKLPPGTQVENMMITPFGLWRIDDAMNPFKQFKIWMGHTNFSIGRKAVSILVDIPGVEILKVISRYRFLIGIGELFDIREVRMHIENALCGKHRIEYLIKDIDDEDIRKKVIETKDKLARKYKKWAIYVFPNGSIDFIVNSEDEDIDFNKKLVMYKEAKEKSNGILIESE